ncbi:MAG: DUF2891 domain-containing protein [Gammaproteobacteria bacterium]
MPPLDEARASRLAKIALAAIEREYPNHLTHFLNDAGDLQPPRSLHPAFYGALDWHSAVHNHWLLARLATRFPDAPFAPKARAVLERHLRAEHIARERAYFDAPGRESFERPYGWAWLLALDTELAAFPAQRAALSPLTEWIATRVTLWLNDLPYPVRSGGHANTAFALGLMLDWARANKREAMANTLVAAAKRFYLRDRAARLAYEPSGEDFLSPALAEANLMARVLERGAFTDWLTVFIPEIPVEVGSAWLTPVEAPASYDYKLAHLAGLNLSRAWMLASIAARLTSYDYRRAVLTAAANEHSTDGLAAAWREDYGASHWLPTFAVYGLGYEAEHQ